jgi:predicted extracellular nuclease
VIATGADAMPVLVGLCEVENVMVVNDLAATLNLSAANYSVVHFDSPDERGIDVALMYNKNIFTPKSKKAIPVTIPSDSSDYTRDILYVSGTLNINGKKEELHVFVNHWPSRSGGEEISAPKRAAAAQSLKHIIDSLNNKFADPNIIIMGDFNDTPFDISTQKILMAQEMGSAYSDETLVNMLSAKQKAGEGTYNYKGNWQILDQIIVSESLLDKTSLDLDPNSVQIVKQDWMLFHHDKYGDSPDRTFSGIKYIGGYSDHLPVYIELTTY